MLTGLIVRIVDACRNWALVVIVAALAGCVGMGAFVASHFKINTDVDQLLAENLGWRQQERELAKAFPHQQDRLVIVVDGVNADVAEAAAAKIAEELKKRPETFKTVSRPDAIPFFRKNGFLFLSEDKLTGILETLVKAQPMLGSLAKDPSLRGLFSTMALTVRGVQEKEVDYESLVPSFRIMTETIDSVLDHRDQKLPWQSMMSDKPPSLRELRKFILTQPVLDFNNLSPGAKATKIVRQIIDQNDLISDRGVYVRLTGSVALNDEEFASVADGMEISVALSFLLVILLLDLALRSARLILPILITLVAGLIATTAFAMAAVGSLNLISVAFAVMFVGIAVDFGIQFGVRLRDEHHREPDFAQALRTTARVIAPPLGMAAATTTLGFLAFVPTDYRGVSELGIIAGVGMIVAYVLNLTLLPALLTVFKPPAEPEEIGYAWARPLDRFLESHRRKVLVVLALVALAAGLEASRIRFDFDPLDLKNPKAESVRTMFAIMEDPDATPYTLDILAPSLEAARTLAAQIDKLPEVDHTITLASFVPEDQAAKLALIDDAKLLLDPSLNPASPMDKPTDADVLETMKNTAAQLRTLGQDKTAARALADALDKVVERGDPALLARLYTSMIGGMVSYLDVLRGMLSGQGVTLADITDDLRRDWITQDGRAKIEVYPKGNARDPKVLAAFTDSVRRLAPNATGAPISIQESGRTVVGAFTKAGILGIFVISLLAFAVLRRVGDVVRLILPLFLAGALTLATMVMISLPLNFANIIALPLLMSLGVSYAIYFVSYWRQGREHPLSSSMARAVLFSAGTTLVAFGSLSLSSHPGTSGMGLLLTIALIYSVLCTFIVLPVLLGRPPSIK